MHQLRLFNILEQYFFRWNGNDITMIKFKTLLCGLVLFTSTYMSAQSLTKDNTDFLESRSTAGIYAETSKDVRHIVGRVKWFSKTRRYNVFDQGLIDDVEYDYFISDDGNLIVGVPRIFPNNYYITSICAFRAQGELVTEAQMRTLQEKAKCL